MSNLQIFDITGIFLLALIIGGMFFFAAIMTPLVFTKLPPEISGPFIRETFPVYSQFMAGMTLAAVFSLWGISESAFRLRIEAAPVQHRDQLLAMYANPVSRLLSETVAIEGH